MRFIRYSDTLSGEISRSLTWRREQGMDNDPYNTLLHFFARQTRQGMKKCHDESATIIYTRSCFFYSHFAHFPVILHQLGRNDERIVLYTLFRAKP